MNQTVLPLPNPGDWCTYPYAARQLNVTRQTVHRMVAERTLTAYKIAGGTSVLWLPEVRALADARRAAGYRPRGWRTRP